MGPSIWWVRRDMRLGDNPALVEAAASGAVLPVFIFDERFERLGAAPRWRVQEGLRALARALEARGSRLILRRGAALDVLRDLIGETGARAVHWMRLYDPLSREVDAAVKTALKAEGVQAESHAGHLLQEPMYVQSKSGGYYKVFTPFWRAIRAMDVPAPVAVPTFAAPESRPASDTLWDMAPDMRRGADVLARHVACGEKVALEKLDRFFAERAQPYKSARDMVGEAGTSELSDHLALGEISPRLIWARGLREDSAGAEAFLREVGWRDFAHHLMYHTPHMLEANWREGWDGFPWSEDDGGAHFKAWCLGQTGVDFVDAAMRELWVTGKIHNRARMVAASYLTKHLMVHWRLGERWFADQLVDFDPASNAMGWQWVAGCGPDAAPYFRVFNPDTQLEKFDPAQRYRRRWLESEDYEAAIPLSAPRGRPLLPIVDLKEGRARALAAYEANK